MEEVTADVVETARELESAVEPECGTELLPSHTWTDEDLRLMEEQINWFLEMGSTPGEDVVTTVEVTTKNSEDHTSWADKAAVGCQMTDSQAERSSPVGRMLSNSIPHYREIPHERKSPSVQQTSVLSDFKNLAWPPQPSAATTLISQQPSMTRQTLHQQKRPWLPESSGDVSIS